MVAPLSEVPQEGSSVFSLFSLIKLHLASHPLASSYSHVAVSSVFCAQCIHISDQTRGAPLTLMKIVVQQLRGHVTTVHTTRVVQEAAPAYQTSPRAFDNTAGRLCGSVGHPYAVPNLNA